MSEETVIPESGSILVTEKGVSLPNIPATGFILSNWNIDNKASFPYRRDTTNAFGDANAPADAKATTILQQSGNEIIWGFNGNYAHQLFAGQTTPLFPCGNLSEVSLRTRPGQKITIFYSYFQKGKK